MKICTLLLLALVGCGLPVEDARMLLAGAQAASSVNGAQRLEMLSVTCGRIPDCARGCEPAFEDIAHAPPAEALVLLRRCPDVARVVPAGETAAQVLAAQTFFLGRLGELAPKAKKKLPEADGKRLDCLLRALQLQRPDASGC